MEHLHQLVILLRLEQLKNVFKSHSKEMIVNSTKSMTGHFLGAAGAIERILIISN